MIMRAPSAGLLCLSVEFLRRTRVEVAYAPCLIFSFYTATYSGSRRVAPELLSILIPHPCRTHGGHIRCQCMAADVCLRFLMRFANRKDRPVRKLNSHRRIVASASRRCRRASPPRPTNHALNRVTRDSQAFNLQVQHTESPKPVGHSKPGLIGCVYVYFREEGELFLHDARRCVSSVTGESRVTRSAVIAIDCRK